MHKFALLMTGILLTAWGCGSDDGGPVSPCPAEVDLGAFALEPASAGFVPYQLTEEAIVFRDTFGTEYPFRIAGRDQGVLFGGLLTRPCPEDPAFQVRYQWQNEFRYWELVSDSLGLSFDLVITTAPGLADPPARQVSDVLHIRVAGPSAPADEPLVLSVLIDARNNPAAMQPATFAASRTLAGKAFTEVYWDEELAQATGYGIYFSPLYGVVGVAHDTLFLVWDRVE